MSKNTYDKQKSVTARGIARGLVALLLSGLIVRLGIAEEGEERSKRPITAMELPDIEVIGTTPLPILGTPLNQVPGNVQSAEDEAIYRQESLDLSRFLNRNFASVNINEVQNNPFQPDVTYRGFTASPLIGTPIGLSVYQDGVRVNEPFGDTVNWDLIPRSAIANIDLIPGSNPLFGLNSLGGALSIRTKSGFSHPGTRAQIYGGSFGRKAFELEHGGFKGPFDWFITGQAFEEDGWRDRSHSNVHQAFVKLGWETENTDIDLSYTFAKNKLTGNGPLPESFLREDRSQIFTFPDITEPELHFLNLKASHQFTPDWILAGNTYYRDNTLDTFNGDVAEDCEQFFSFAECLDEDGELEPSAVNRLSRSEEIGTGVTLQLSYLGNLFARENQFTFGTSYDYGQTDFSQSEQEAVFTPSRGTQAIEDPERVTKVRGINQYIGIFATDTFSPTPWLHLNAAARWNWAEIDLAGFGTDEDTDERTSLTGTHQFDRLNPSVGFTLQPLEALALQSPIQDMTFYANYNEGFRVPTPVELTCADPEAPCSLPNSFIADPPLKPVVAKTWEAGLRGQWSEYLRWSLAAYRTRLSNDILFTNVPDGGLARGFFQNVGATRRQGVELGLQGTFKKLTWYANYSFIEATYQTRATLQNALGPQQIEPGNRIPGIPEQLVKFGAEYEILPGWFFGGDLQYASNQFLRGDDENRLAQVPEYVVVNLHSRYRVTKHLEIFALANNVLDTEYETFGVVNRNFFSGAPEGGTPERFLGPGAPIGGWAGLRVYWN